MLSYALHLNTSLVDASDAGDFDSKEGYRVTIDALNCFWSFSLHACGFMFEISKIINSE